MDLSLKNKEWKEFELTKIFNIKSGKRLTTADMSKGLKPFIGATEYNNGITAYVSNSNSSEDFNVLGVNYNGSVVENFYHPYKALFSDDVKRLSFIEIKGNKYLFLFAKTQILKQKSKYQYGYKFNGARMERQKILLPINSKGDPDYEFMEAYIKQKENEKIDVYKNYISRKVRELQKTKKVISLSEKEWSEFFIEDIAEINSGQDIYKSERSKGSVPYVTSTALNNGVGYFVGNDNKTLEKDCLSVNRNGSVGYSFYHDYEALYSNDCRKLRLKYSSKYVGIFISQQITRQKDKYGYGYKMGTARIKRQKIMLPINKKQKPDYEYMENYMKRLELSKLKKYLKYKEKNTKV